MKIVGNRTSIRPLDFARPVDPVPARRKPLLRLLAINGLIGAVVTGALAAVVLIAVHYTCR